MQDAVQVRVEPTSVMELEKFFKATYTLEGDGHLIFIAFQKREDPSSYSRSQFSSYPRCGSRTVSSEHWRPAKMVPVWPKGVCDACLVVSPTMKVFRAAQLFSIRAVKLSRPTAADVERIRARDVPFKNTNDVIQSLKDELPTYLVKAVAISDAFDILSDSMQWWKDVRLS